VADRSAAASGGDRQSLLSAAQAVRAVDLAVLNVVLVGHFGVTAVLAGVASWTSPSYGPAVAAPVLLGGGAGIASGMLQALSGRLTTVSYLVLLTASLLLFTVWLLAASALLLRRAGAP
jgi:hypothetical protein